MKKNKILRFILFIIIIIVLILGGYSIYQKVLNIDFNKYSNLLGINGKGNLISDYKNLEDSHITGEDYNIDTTYYPYYSFLSSEEQILYKQIYANIDNLETTFVPIVELDHNKVSKIIEAVTDDHPEIFWMGDTYTYKYTKDGICRQITLEFNNLVNNYTNNKYSFDYQANIIINNANSLSSNYEKEKYVHDTLINKISYNKNSSYNQTAYSALVNNSTVCAGYAKAFQYIMIKLNIPTYYVTGTSEGEDHAWNIVKLDGYYNVDLTWDDNQSNHYYYFNITDNEFSKTHTRGNLSSNLPSCLVTTYKYKNQNKKQNNNTQREKQKVVIEPKEEEKEEEVINEPPKEITEEEIEEEEREEETIIEEDENNNE